MSDNTIDIIGQILWFSMFATPLFTIPFIWKKSEQSKAMKIIIGLLLAFSISVILFIISMAILLRDGLGPG